MTINFGDNYFEETSVSFWQDLLIAVVGGFLGVLGAIYVYKRQDNNKQNDALIYFYRLATGSVSHLEHLYGQITEYVNEQRKNIRILSALNLHQTKTFIE